MNKTSKTAEEIPLPPRPGESGFSLVEILVVITIIGLLVTLVATQAPNILDSTRVTACKKQLKDIGLAMELYYGDQTPKSYPRHNGIRFLLQLTAGKGEAAYVTEKNRHIFICPGTDDDNRAPDSDVPGSAYDNLDDLDSFSISYAGRRNKESRARKDSDILAADDNEERANHRRHTNFLMKDGSVSEVSILDFMDEYPDLDWLPVGADSPHEPFHILQVN